MVGGFVIGFLFLGLCFSGLAGRFSFVWGWYNIRFAVVWVGVRHVWLYFWFSWCDGFLDWVLVG